ncbi:MAG: aminoacyl-tRNA hydrolase [Flavobacteriaceae bacterium]|nr:aminoacyl-tRNA hydrolase [Flavobacteriaceae bacterium]
MKKFLIVGLGNIGSEYDYTRHNIGFEVLDTLAEKFDCKFETERLGNVTSFRHKGRTFVLLKPTTYMNLSGKAVKYWLSQENIPLENLLVICDDLNIDFGTIRIKGKGSDGGHNGLKDINATLQTQAYARFRFGIGADFSRGRQVNFVLGKWTDEEQRFLPEYLEKSAQAVVSFGTAGLGNTMNSFNGVISEK